MAEQARRISPALSSATAYLKARLGNGTWTAGEKLPAARELAEKAGVSRPTMLKAIRMLKREGLLFGPDRHRVTVGTLPAASALQQWQQVRRRIEGDILYGRIDQHGRLPQIKELQGMYGVSYQTMKKILVALARSGVIVPSGKGYALPRTGVHSVDWQIVFITFKGHQSQESALNHEHNRVLDIFERECTGRGIRLRTLEIDFFNSLETRRAMARLPAGDTTLGYIFDLWWYSPASYQRACLDVLDRVVSSKKPVSLLDEIGGFVLPGEYATNPLLQVYTIECGRAGERVARYLLSLGHRKAVYISVLHHAVWSKERHQGVVTQFERAGRGGSVAYVADQVAAIAPGSLTASGLPDRDIRTLLAVGSTPAQFAELEEDWAQFKKTHKPPYPGYPRVNPTMARNLSKLAVLIRSRADPLFAQHTCTGALRAVADSLFAQCMKPLVQEALTHTEATAWVCASDAMAIVAMAFAREQGRRVPEDLSIVGFDNVPVRAHEQGLTTYDFNAMGFIRLMLDFILRPRKGKRGYRHVAVEVEGIIVERETTTKRVQDGR